MFGKFFRDSSNLDLSIPTGSYRWTEELLFAAAEHYENEGARVEKYQTHFAEIFGPPASLTYGTVRPRGTDGVWYSTVGGRQFAFKMMMEVKAEMCGISGEPVLQASKYYHGYWTQALVRFHLCIQIR